MISKRQAAWQAFSDCVLEHIKATESGHYGGATIQPLDFLEQWFSPDALAWQSVKYLCRYPKTNNERDLYKASDYICRLWALHRKGAPKPPL